MNSYGDSQVVLMITSPGTELLETPELSLKLHSRPLTSPLNVAVEIQAKLTSCFLQLCNLLAHLHLPAVGSLVYKHHVVFRARRLSLHIHGRRKSRHGRLRSSLHIRWRKGRWRSFRLDRNRARLGILGENDAPCLVQDSLLVLAENRLYLAKLGSSVLLDLLLLA